MELKRFQWWIVMKFKYLKGSEKDFAGAPEWARYVTIGVASGLPIFIEKLKTHSRARGSNGKEFLMFVQDGFFNTLKIIAQRELITEPAFKYIKGGEIDFTGAPGWAMFVVRGSSTGTMFYVEHLKAGARYQSENWRVESVMHDLHLSCEIIAQREPIAEPEKLGHGLDCEECKPREGKVFADFFVPAFRNYANELFSTKNNTQSPSRTEEKMANITMNVTVDDIKPVIDKIISDLAKEPIELSLQIINGRPVISDQFGRVLENQITGVEFGINSKLPPQVTISAQFKETK